MSFTLYAVLYALLLGIFVSFGRFMKECDESLVEKARDGQPYNW
ncbi:MAG: hypothetical protein WCW40_08895 [Bacteroidota bacterium]